ncbi:MAG: sodium:calcium antiporter [Promethearchaeota archaeon]
MLGFILGLGLLLWGADAALDGIVDISEQFGISPILLALLVMGVDLEEFIASITGSLNGLPEIAIGNVIGNNLISLTLIFALPGFFFAISFKKVDKFNIGLLWIQSLIIFLSVILPIQLWISGIISFGLYIIYVIHTFKYHKPEFKEKIDSEIQEAKEEISEKSPKKRKKEIVWQISKFIAAIIALYFGSYFLIHGINNLMANTSLNEGFIGVFIVAASTNIEEYFLIFASIKKRRLDIGINTLLGKIIWNSCATFGLSAMIITKSVGFSQLILMNAGLLTFLAAPLFGFIAIHRKKLQWKYAIPLMLIFIIYIVFVFIF